MPPNHSDHLSKISTCTCPRNEPPPVHDIGDGLTDYQEKERYHTDPESRVTYEITREHQREVIGVLQKIREDWDCLDDHCGMIYWDMRHMGFISDDGSTMDRVEDLEGFQLTDRTDDFDFVVTDDYADRDEQWSRFSFRPLDTNEIPEVQIYRTDVWLPNGFESSVRQTDPWDPDTDDDGLTDGQETRGMTRIGSPEVHTDPAPYEAHLDQPIDTYPHLADSDGDGWWDGWIGVHGVGRSDNVILYNEHLRTGDGIEDDEVVTEQAGLHDVDQAPAPRGVDINGDGTRQHSNVHVGELQFGTDTRHAGEAPDVRFSMEVDFYEEDDDALSLHRQSWEHGIERNFRLYGFQVDIQRDDTLSRSEVTSCALPGPLTCTNPDNGFSITEVWGISRYHDSLSTTVTAVVLDRAGAELGSDQTGINLWRQPNVGLFTQGNDLLAQTVPASVVQNSPYNSALEVVAAKTMIHEIGHSLTIGRHDDTDFGSDPLGIFQNFEVYSGSSDDASPEQLQSNGRVQWSIMGSGYLPQMTDEGTLNGTFFIFSIEELMSVDP